MGWRVPSAISTGVEPAKDAKHPAGTATGSFFPFLATNATIFSTALTAAGIALTALIAFSTGSTLISVIVALDPDNPPDAESAEVHLLVTETACASGKPADGRVALERLVEHDDRVELVVGVEAPPGEGHSCPSNPPTPFTVELDEPLGTRPLVDVAVYPERELAAPSRACRRRPD